MEVHLFVVLDGEAAARLADSSASLGDRQPGLPVLCASSARFLQLRLDRWATASMAEWQSGKVAERQRSKVTCHLATLPQCKRAIAHGDAQFKNRRRINAG